MSDKPLFSRKAFDRNQTIFEEGDHANAVYVLRSGSAEIRTGTHGENPRAVTRIRSGDVFGELALLEGRLHESTAVALDRCEVLEVPRAEFMRRLNAADPVMKAVVNHLVSRLKETTAELEDCRSSPW